MPTDASDERRRLVTAYAVWRFKNDGEWGKREPDAFKRGYLAGVAKGTKFSASQISDVAGAKKGKGVGPDLEEALEKFWKMARGELYEEAKRFAASADRAAAQAPARLPRIVMADERYPYRADAAKLARKAGCSERAIASVVEDAQSAGSESDHPVQTWLEWMLQRDRQLKEMERGRGLPGRAISHDEG